MKEYITNLPTGSVLLPITDVTCYLPERQSDAAILTGQIAAFYKKYQKSDNPERQNSTMASNRCRKCIMTPIRAIFTDRTV